MMNDLFCTAKIACMKRYFLLRNKNMIIKNVIIGYLKS